MSYIRTVILHPEMGVYIGRVFGMGFWSLLDAHGRCEVTTFRNFSQARESVHAWQFPFRNSNTYEYREVACADSMYATADELVKANISEEWVVKLRANERDFSDG